MRVLSFANFVCISNAIEFDASFLASRQETPPCHGSLTNQLVSFVLCFSETAPDAFCDGYGVEGGDIDLGKAFECFVEEEGAE